MSSPTNSGAAVYSQGLGSVSLASLGIIPITSPVAPSPTNIVGPAGPLQLGQLWINPKENDAYILSSLVSSNGVVSANWLFIQESGGDFEFFHNVTFESTSSTNFLSGSTISVNAGSVWAFNDTPAFHLGYSVTAGSVSFAAPVTINVNSGATWTFNNLPSFANGLLLSAGNFMISGPSSKIVIDAANPTLNSVGTATLSAGAATVTTSAVTASSKIYVSINTASVTPGVLSAPSSSIVAGTSFVIHSSVGTDTSTVNYWIIN